MAAYRKNFKTIKKGNIKQVEDLLFLYDLQNLVELLYNVSEKNFIYFFLHVFDT